MGVGESETSGHFWLPTRRDGGRVFSARVRPSFVGKGVAVIDGYSCFGGEVKMWETVVAMLAGGLLVFLGALMGAAAERGGARAERERREGK